MNTLPSRRLFLRSGTATKGTPLCNLWLALLQGVGVNVGRHGDSTGPLKEVMA